MQTRNGYRILAAVLMSGALLTGCAQAEDDFAVNIDKTYAPLLGQDAENIIPNQYIVVFKEDAARSSMNAAMNRLSNRIERSYSVIPGFSARLSDSDLDQLRRDSSVDYIEHDRILQLDAVFPSPADGIDRVDQREGRDGQYNDHGLDGSGVDVFIVDTGIRTSHNEFNGRVNNGAGFTAINDGNGFQDCNGHGTHVASTAAGTQFGIAKGANVVAVRVLSCNGSGSLGGVIDGVNHVANACNGPCVANMSLGGGASAALDQSVANAVAAGIPFAVAAGNDNSNACNFSPAREASAITVGASADNDSRAGFSNFGSCVDLFAPGVSILGADIGSDNDTQSISGTSMASPHVAGVIAQFLGANPNASPAQVEAAIEGAASTNCVDGANGSPNLFLHNDFNAPPFDCNGGGGGGDDTCENRCGEFDQNAACQCDDACADFGDCCPDIDQFCGADPNSCVGNCGGQAPGGCFCDDACVNFGDCCADKLNVCG